MAALALQTPLAETGRMEQDDIHAFIASFSGKNVYILDYLADEVFNRQSADVQAFLLKTSVLEKMNADLCDALLQVNAGEGVPQQRGSKAILEYLERSNLFLIPLDQERCWFRYYHLFADLLRARLAETWPGLRPAFLVQASLWFERSGSQEDAINYALAAEDWERAAALMEQHIRTFLELGQLSKIVDWVGRLPKEIAASRPGLIIQQAWVMGLAQRKEAFFALLDSAEKLLTGANPVDEEAKREHQRLWINVKTLRGYQEVIEGRPQQGLDLLKDPFESYPTGGLWKDTWLLWVRGYAYRAAGNLEEALRWCDRLALSAKKSGRVRSLVELQAAGLQLKTFPKGMPWDPAALVHLETALSLGESGGFLRVFLEEGPLIERMLRAVRSRPARFGLAYLDSILASFEKKAIQGAEGTESTLSQSGEKSLMPAAEPLTERELEVLRLMASGLSNREMAEKLILSEGTIKSHVHNLMGKLGAQSRTHALALAKQFHLL